MIDWKIFAASIVALLFIATLFLGSAKDGASGIFSKLGDYLGNSPFDSSTAKPVAFSVAPKELTITPDKEATISTGDTVFSHFTGSITISLANKTVHLQSDGMSVTFPLTSLNVSDITLKSLVMAGVKLDLKPDISTDAADIDMKAFSGTLTATSSGIQFTGTTPQLKVKIGDLTLAVV